MVTERWPVWAMIARSDAPPAAADVARPARSECPAYSAGSRPAFWAARWTMRATPRSLSRCRETTPCRDTGRNSGPAAIPASDRHATTARTGQVLGWRPRGMPTSRPWPSWSVLPRRIRTRSPSSVSSRSSTSSETSSLRRKPPLKPSRSRARSRAPARPVGSVAASSWRSSAVSRAVFWVGAVPRARQIPAIVARTHGSAVGGGEQLAELGGEQGGLLGRGCAEGAADPRHRRPDHGIGGRGRHTAGHLVGLGERRDPALQGRGLRPRLGQGGEVERDRRRRRRQRPHTLALAPVLEVGEVAAVGADRVRRLAAGRVRPRGVVQGGLGEAAVAAAAADDVHAGTLHLMSDTVLLSDVRSTVHYSRHPGKGRYH